MEPFTEKGMYEQGKDEAMNMLMIHRKGEMLKGKEDNKCELMRESLEGRDKRIENQRLPKRTIHCQIT